MNQSVGKALKLLQLFTLERPRLSLAEIARMSGLSKPTAYRFLKALEQEGVVSRSSVNQDDKMYQLVERGHSISYGEHVAGTLGISAPIRDHTGSVIASLTIAIPGDHFSRERTDELISQLKRTALEISRECGYMIT